MLLPQFSQRSASAVAFSQSTPHTAHREHSARGSPQQKLFASHQSTATDPTPRAFNPHSSHTPAGGLVHAIFCHRPRQPTSRRYAGLVRRGRWQKILCFMKSSQL
jgi:hypothetical protein